MIEKINLLKTKSNSDKVKTLCETATDAISSSIYNNVTPEAKIEIERVTINELFEELSKINDKEVKKWSDTQKRLFTIRNLGIREAINSLNETKELKEILESFRDLLNNGVHEARLYEQFITALSPFGYFPTVGNAIKAVEDRVKTYKSDVDIVKIVETMKETRSNYLIPFIEDVINNYITDKNTQTKHQLSETLMKFTYDPFVRDIVSLITLDATELQLEYANAECDIEKVYSPVLYLGENEAIFAVNNVYYVKKGNNVSRLPQVDILKIDEEFKTLCETLSNPNIVVNKEKIIIYHRNDKAIISEKELFINDKLMNEEEFKSSVEVSEFVGNKEFFMLVEFLKSNFNEVAEIDFVKRVYLKENFSHSADIFKLRDNVFITTHNPELGKSTFFRNVNPIQAKNIMMEHLHFDVTSVFKGLLPDEEKINNQINETKEAYNDYIKDLVKRESEFKLNPFGTEVNEQVVEALQEELKEVKDEYKDYLNHIEKYMRPSENIDEEIVIDINIDGKKYTIPIPQEVNGGGEKGEKGEEGVSVGTDVGGEFISDEPASAITFDDEDTELLGDTPTIPDDEIDLGTEDAEAEAEEAEVEAEEEKKEVEGDDDIKIEDEVDIDSDEVEKEEKEEEEEKIRKKKKEKLESSDGSLKKSSFIREAGEGEEEIEDKGEKKEEKKKKKRIFLKKKVTESKKINEQAPKVKGIVESDKKKVNELWGKKKSERNYRRNLSKDQSGYGLINKISELLFQASIDPDYISPNLVANIAAQNNIELDADEVVEISDNYDKWLEDLSTVNIGWPANEKKIIKIGKKLNENAQIGDTVIFNKQKGNIIGQTGGNLIVQVQGSSELVNPSEVKVMGTKVETIKPPFKFSKETQKLLFEQYVKCGIYMGQSPIKTNDCYVRYSDWTEASNSDQINIVVEGQLTLLPKEQIKIFEDINTFANLDNYIEGVIIDEVSEEALENVRINVVDYTEAIGDADPVRIIRGGEGEDPGTDTLPKARLRTLAV